MTQTKRIKKELSKISNEADSDVFAGGIELLLNDSNINSIIKRALEEKTKEEFVSNLKNIVSNYMDKFQEERRKYYLKMFDRLDDLTPEKFADSGIYNR